MIILALIAMVMVSIAVVGTAALILNAKKQSKSTSISATAYMHAEEAAECSLWARSEALKCANSTVAPCNFYNATSPMFPKSIQGYYCNSASYAGFIDYFHDTVGTVVPACASPIWVTGIFTKGKQGKAAGDNFSETSDKMRGLGVTVKTPTSASIKTFVSCNKMAEYGDTSANGRNYTGCNATSPQGNEADAGPTSANRGWLEYWPECSGICNADACAYYNSSLDDTQTSIYTGADVRQQGAHWCWTAYDAANSRPNLAQQNPGTACYCMDSHNSAGNQNYWNHPDILGDASGSSANSFCDPCKRLSQEVRAGLGGAFLTCGGSTGVGTGDYCGTMAGWGIGAVNAKVWGRGPAAWGGAANKPGASCQGELDQTNCWACWCPAFEAQNDDPGVGMCSNVTGGGAVPAGFCDQNTGAGVNFKCGPR